jgi:hypothetical protein
MTATVFKLKPPGRGSRTDHASLSSACRILDGRSSEARLLRQTRDALLEGVPPPVSPLAAGLAERGAYVYLRLLQASAHTSCAVEPRPLRGEAQSSPFHRAPVRKITGGSQARK